MNRAYRPFWTCKGMLRKNWKAQSKVLHWLYNMVIWPTVTFAANMWSSVKSRTSRAKIMKLHRLACLGITEALGMTPTAAVEVLLELLPLHLKANTSSIYTLVQWTMETKIWLTQASMHVSGQDRRTHTSENIRFSHLTCNISFYKVIHLSHKDRWFTLLWFVLYMIILVETRDIMWCGENF
jgi:hypothetical protein